MPRILVSLLITAAAAGFAPPAKKLPGEFKVVADTPEHIKKIVEEGLIKRAELLPQMRVQVKGMQRQLAAMKKAKIVPGAQPTTKGPPVYRSREEKQLQVDAMEGKLQQFGSDLEKLESGEVPIKPFPKGFTINAVGRFLTPVRVVRVNGSETVAEVSIEIERTFVATSGVKVDGISYNAGDTLVDRRPEKHEVILRNQPQLAAGQEVTLPSAFIVVAAGKPPTLEPIDLRQYVYR